MSGWMDGWVGRWMDGRTNEWMDGYEIFESSTGMMLPIRGIKKTGYVEIMKFISVL